jgi:FkbM family methyltransferase
MLARGQTYEPFETQWIQYLLRPGDVVLDIGAHIGYYTILFSELVGVHGKVIAFEPDPQNFDLLRENVARNVCRNVTLHNVALSDKNGTVTLYLSSDNAGDHRIWRPAEIRPTVAVPTVSLDRLWGSAPPKIDAVKMDIQGAEGMALRGMKNLLHRQERLTLFVEFWPMGLKQAESSANDFLQGLIDLQCDLFVIDERGRRLLQVEPEQLIRAFDSNKDDFINLLCVRKGTTHQPNQFAKIETM